MIKDPRRVLECIPGTRGGCAEDVTTNESYMISLMASPRTVPVGRRGGLQLPLLTKPTADENTACFLTAAYTFANSRTRRYLSRRAYNS